MSDNRNTIDKKQIDALQKECKKWTPLNVIIYSGIYILTASFFAFIGITKNDKASLMVSYIILYYMIIKNVINGYNSAVIYQKVIAQTEAKKENQSNTKI
jgi:hypothetical protein